MDRNEVQYAVLVQIRGQYNNDYQFECVDRFPESARVSDRRRSRTPADVPAAIGTS